MITILTPTYNRGYILPNLYQSLIKQSVKHFEWIIIDDGSSDNTRDIVAEWLQDEIEFDIKYINQENGGKHRAINRGISLAQFPYCLIVDSDDYLTIDAVEKIHLWIDTIKDKPTFAGVAGLKGYIRGGRVGGYPKESEFQSYVDATNLERRKFHLHGDKAEVYCTEVLKKYLFPEFPGENFMTEEVVWNAIAREGYKIRWFNHIIYRCDYLDDGLTKEGSRKFLNNFEGYTYLVLQRMEFSGWLSKQFAAGEYAVMSRKKGILFKEAALRLNLNRFSLAGAFLFYIMKNMIKSILFNFRTL